MPPIFITAIASGLAALIPKALTDAYDYIFNGEEIQVKKVPDRTELTDEQIATANGHYQRYLLQEGSYRSQKELTVFLNLKFNTDKSVAQMMRICRGS